MACRQLLTVILFLSIDMGNMYPNVIQAPRRDSYNDLIEYTLYEEKVSWNDAAAICASQGAHLLTLKSQEKFDLILELQIKEFRLFSYQDYWIGLAEPSEDVFVWEDCTYMTYNSLKEESYDPGKLCYLVKHHTPYIWERKSCHEDHYFACEKIIQGGCDHRFSTTLNARMLTYINTSINSCQNNCSSSSSCWAGISTDTGHCVLMAFQTEYEPPLGVTMFQKTCVKVETVPPADVPVISSNIDNQPSINCITTNTEIILVPDATDYVSLNETETVNITAVVTSSSEEHLTTLSLDIFSKLITITETYNLTQTLTSTIYETKGTETCFNISHVYLSTNDPILIEAISSMKQDLIVDKKTTTAYKRSKISSPDKRTSSRVIGAWGLIILIIPASLIIITDIPVVVRQYKATLKAFRNKQCQCRKRNH
ncbi:MRC [Mytilus coruscus]|uniref:MRC n=1 Tax=Mytilus coruscus TaxID=42192 RepID=A0A6J8F1Y0_MYTCO|nr:MRC [Mytilus coruscus]